MVDGGGSGGDARRVLERCRVEVRAARLEQRLARRPARAAADDVDGAKQPKQHCERRRVRAVGASAETLDAVPRGRFPRGESHNHRGTKAVPVRRRLRVGFGVRPASVRRGRDCGSRAHRNGDGRSPGCGFKYASAV